MIPIAVIAVDGVLRDVVSGSPIQAGKRLYDALVGSYRVVLVMDESIHEMWLKVNGFIEHDNVIPRLPEDPDDIVSRRRAQIERARGIGFTVELLVDPNPLVVADAFKLGVICLHYVDPPYARPEFHPSWTEKITAWDQLVEEIDHARTMRATDKRMLEDD